MNKALKMISISRTQFLKYSNEKFTTLTLQLFTVNWINAITNFMAESCVPWINNCL